MKYIVTQKNVVSVEQLPNGSLVLSKDGRTLMPDMGLFILNCGGIKKVLERCVESELPFDDFKQQVEKKNAEIKRQRHEAYLKRCKGIQ